MQPLKTIVIGDIHGRPIWKEIIEKEKPDKVVFVGDYFDSYDYHAEKQIHNFLDIAAYKASNPDNIVLLIGNHDFHYIHGDNGTSGYQENYAYVIQHAIKQHFSLLQMAYQMDNILFTHAGVSSIWLENTLKVEKFNGKIEDLANTINNLYNHSPEYFLFNGRSGTGDDPYQTPIWIRPRSLMVANKESLTDKIIQVVGHTSVETIDIQGKATNGRYYFIDALGVRQYLIIEDGQFKLGRL